MNIMFVETRVFTRRLGRLGLEGALKALQEDILANPEVGPVDPGTGGLRKIRIPDEGRGKGKRGGARVHYLWLPDKRLVYFLSVYAKDEEDTLSAEQKRILKDVVRAIKEAHKEAR
jgi:mRNA-degrading endonuclease RelE of RelBE toxin-antitoxin system